MTKYLFKEDAIVRVRTGKTKEYWDCVIHWLQPIWITGTVGGNQG